MKSLTATKLIAGQFPDSKDMFCYGDKHMEETWKINEGMRLIKKTKQGVQDGKNPKIALKFSLGPLFGVL